MAIVLAVDIIKFMIEILLVIVGLGFLGTIAHLNAINNKLDTLINDKHENCIVEGE